MSARAQQLESVHLRSLRLVLCLYRLDPSEQHTHTHTQNSNQIFAHTTSTLGARRVNAPAWDLGQPVCQLFSFCENSLSRFLLLRSCVFSCFKCALRAHTHKERQRKRKLFQSIGWRLFSNFFNLRVQYGRPKRAQKIRAGVDSFECIGRRDMQMRAHSDTKNSTATSRAIEIRENARAGSLALAHTQINTLKYARCLLHFASGSRQEKILSAQCAHKSKSDYEAA